MPHAARFKTWDDTPESETKARRAAHKFLKLYALRARENACFAVLTDQTGRAGYVESGGRANSENQAAPRRAPALIWGPDGELIAYARRKKAA